MKRIGNTIIIGVDLRQKGPLDLFAACSGNGYGNIKSANTVTPAGITAYDTRPVFTDHLLEYQGTFYRIGEGHKEFTPDKSADADYYLLTLAAVARELNAVQVYDADIHLAAGLPLTWVRSQRETFRQYLMQNPAVSYRYNGKEYSVRFSRCSIYPQGYPAIVPELSHYKGTHLLADIGNGTMNIMYIIDKKPVESKCRTEKLGVNQCMISVKNTIFPVIFPKRIHKPINTFWKGESMNYFHLQAKSVSRGARRSAVAASAYASCSLLYNDYDGIAHNFTRKHGCLHSEILLPESAPEEWKDRQTLWNAVETVEKAKDSRLAWELIVALPVELSLEDWQEMVRQFIQQTCVSLGMCADFSIHDPDEHNPHAHILLTVHPLDEKGQWQAKMQKEYICRRGIEERGFTASEFKEAAKQGWEKQYKYDNGEQTVYLMPNEAAPFPEYTRISKTPKSTRYGRQNPTAAVWNSEDQLLTWRKTWEETVNKWQEHRGIPDRVDCRSNAARGLEEQPTIHEGYHARKIEKAGYISDRCEMNRLIQADNRMLQEARKLVQELAQSIKDTVPEIAAAMEAIRNQVVTLHFHLMFNLAQLSGIGVFLQDKVPFLKKYGEINASLQKKVTERKNIRLVDQKLSPLQIPKHLQYHAQIQALTEEIEELKSQRDYLLSRLDCSSPDEASQLEQRMRDLQQLRDKLIAQNEGINRQKAEQIEKYQGVTEMVTRENWIDVRNECTTIRNQGKLNLIEKLKSIFKDHFDHKLFEDAEKAADTDLPEVRYRIDKTQLKEPEHPAQDEPTHKPKHRGYSR